MTKCNKIGYASFREAQAIINNAKKHVYNKNSGTRRNKLVGKKDKMPRRSYKCELCGMWHITSKIALKDVRNKNFRLSNREH
jgi:hypothetical protein